MNILRGRQIQHDHLALIFAIVVLLLLVIVVGYHVHLVVLFQSVSSCDVILINFVLM